MLSEKLAAIFNDYNGTLPTKIALQQGINKETLRKAYLRGDIERPMRGVYTLPQHVFDDLFALQSVYSQGIYSHESAHYLHHYGTLAPFDYHLTFPQGYNTRSLERNRIKAHYIKKDFHNLGLTTVESLSGNPLRVYDRERTLLDLLASDTTTAETISEFLAEYIIHPASNLPLLKAYAKALKREALAEKVLELSMRATIFGADSIDYRISK